LLRKAKFYPSSPEGFDEKISIFIQTCHLGVLSGVLWSHAAKNYPNFNYIMYTLLLHTYLQGALRTIFSTSDYNFAVIEPEEKLTFMNCS
jgi:hypothetical protein